MQFRLHLMDEFVHYINKAPKDCLQYLTDSSGTIKSFNWRDIASTATRQLANQNFKICFRSELVANMVSVECVIFIQGYVIPI